MDKETAAKLLDKAAQICVSKHAGQRDKMGCAYFQHPMRVAMRCKSDEEKMVALLHDTIEDSDVTAEYLLAEGFPQAVVDGILSVTKRMGESYEDFVARAKQNPLGRVVKLHDLEDNLDVMRLDEVSADMALRFTKYLKAVRFLTTDDTTKSEKETMRLTTKCSNLTLRIAAIQREDSNKEIERIIKSKKGNPNEFTLSVTMGDKSIICNRDGITTFKSVIGQIGYEQVEALEIYDGKLPLVTHNPLYPKSYSEATKGWFVLSKISNQQKAFYLNQICDALNLPIVTRLVSKPDK